MIIKIKSHKRESFQKILEYMINSKERVFKDDKSFTLTHNLKGSSISEWVKQFKENERLRNRRRKDSIILTHEILSWHREDAKKLTLEKMRDLTREYIRNRNPKGLFVAVPHFDKKHFHVHICASGVEYKTGKSLRLSKADLLVLKKSMLEYQRTKYSELENSIVEQGRKKEVSIVDKEYQYKLRTGRATDKEQLIAILKTCYEKASSKETFLKLLNECNVEIYERGNKTQGVIFNGMKFRFSRLGFTIERIDYLNKSQLRQRSLSLTRKNNMNTEPRLSR